MLILKNADMDGLVSMSQVVQALEVAYSELGHDVAKNAPRARLYVPTEWAGRSISSTTSWAPCPAAV